jgi:hypothetical protein
MQSLTGVGHTTSHTIGQLCVGGDWACAHGDLEALAHVARRLAECTTEPLHCELVELASLCQSDPDRATMVWTELKPQLFRSDLAS